MNKNEWIKIIIKVVIYALGLIATALGITSLTSCQTSHGVTSTGKAVVITTDTTIIKHNGFVRSKNYVPYD